MSNKTKIVVRAKIENFSDKENNKEFCHIGVERIHQNEELA